MLACSCQHNHPLREDHKCKLILANKIRLPSYSLPRVFKDKLSPTQKIYAKREKQMEQLITTIMRYQATKHITLLNLRNPTSWREYKDLNLWLEDFRTEGNKTGCLDNITKLCVPKGKQLDHFMDKTVNFLKDTPLEPICHR